MSRQRSRYQKWADAMLRDTRGRWFRKRRADVIASWLAEFEKDIHKGIVKLIMELAAEERERGQAMMEQQDAGKLHKLPMKVSAIELCVARYNILNRVATVLKR